MADPARIDPTTLRPVQPAGPQKQADAPRTTPEGQTFADVLRTKVGDAVRPQDAPGEAAEARESTITWSAHAKARLAQRGIELTDAQHARLEGALDRAAAKGAKDALVMLDDTAMVVSVTNRTVITALGMHQARENVFTNIDAAAVA